MVISPVQIPTAVTARASCFSPSSIRDNGILPIGLSSVVFILMAGKQPHSLGGWISQGFETKVRGLCSGSQPEASAGPDLKVPSHTVPPGEWATVLLWETSFSSFPWSPELCGTCLTALLWAEVNQITPTLSPVLSSPWDLQLGEETHLHHSLTWAGQCSGAPYRPTFQEAGICHSTALCLGGVVP